MVAVGTAHADVIKVDGSYGPEGTDWAAPGKLLSMSQFNPNLGTLNSVAYKWRGTLTSRFEATNASGDTDTVHYTASGAMAFNLPGYGLANLVFGPQSGTWTLAVDENQNDLVILNGHGDGSATGDLSSFIGTSVFDVRVLASSNSSMQSDSGNVDTLVRTNASAFLEITYDFTPTTNRVPEPGSLGLLGVALAAAAVASRRRA